jgi:hypothetical protein
VDHSARESMKSAAKRDNYCELQDILSSNNLNANSGFGYSWSHVRLRVDKCDNKIINGHFVYRCLLPTRACIWLLISVNCTLKTIQCKPSCVSLLTVNVGENITTKFNSYHDLRRARLPAELKHLTKRRKRK